MSAFQAELTGVIKGLHITWDLGCRRVIVKVDLKIILAMLVDMA